MRQAAIRPQTTAVGHRHVGHRLEHSGLEALVPRARASLDTGEESLPDRLGERSAPLADGASRSRVLLGGCVVFEIVVFVLIASLAEPAPHGRPLLISLSVTFVGLVVLRHWAASGKAEARGGSGRVPEEWGPH